MCIRDRFSKCEIDYAPESDHSAVSLVLQSNHLNQKRGPGFWKFNTALLKDTAYVTALKRNIPIFKDKYNETHDLGPHKNGDKRFHDHVF